MGVKDFSKTKGALQDIRINLRNDFKRLEQTIIDNQIKAVISEGQNYELQFCVLDENCDPLKNAQYLENWVSAVYFYQNKQNLTPDGLIDKNSATYNVITQETRDKINLLKR